MSAYETASSTLASVLSHPSLDLAHVEKTTDALSELMANQEEIDSAIRLGGQSATKTGEDVDEDSLAEEFEAMVQEEKAREAERLQLEHAAQEREKAQASEERRAKIAELQKKQADLEEQKRLLEADPASQPGSQDEWQRRYDAAQDRQSEEKKRAEVERMQKEERARGAREAREQVAAE
jgi:charged multivesicular body protein 7